MAPTACSSRGDVSRRPFVRREGEQSSETRWRPRPRAESSAREEAPSRALQADRRGGSSPDPPPASTGGRLSDGRARRSCGGRSALVSRILRPAHARRDADRRITGPERRPLLDLRDRRRQHVRDLCAAPLAELGTRATAGLRSDLGPRTPGARRAPRPRWTESPPPRQPRAGRGRLPECRRRSRLDPRAARPLCRRHPIPVEHGIRARRGSRRAFRASGLTVLRAAGAGGADTGRPVQSLRKAQRRSRLYRHRRTHALPAAGLGLPPAILCNFLK